MTWRKNTRSEFHDSRHFCSGWDGRSHDRPRVIPTRSSGWVTLLVRVVALISLVLAAVAVVLWGTA